MASPKGLILAINAGSSSVKLSLFSASETPNLLVESSISGLTAPPATFSYEHVSSNSKHNVKSQELPDVSSQDAAFQHFLSHLASDESLKELHGTSDVAVACHRIVHGGDFPHAMVLSKDTIEELEALTDLAPLHNAPALSLVHTTIKHLPKTKNVAYFDTTFHTGSLPEYVATYPLNPELAFKKKIRRYGFHGISYTFILRETAAYLNKPVEETSIIALHLGSGASACAIKSGKSIDTSMGLTPLEGLPGATRSGTVDPSLVFHYTSAASSLSRASTKELHISKAEDILNKHSGWASLVGTTDFAAITKDMDSDPKKKLAFDIMVDRIVGYVGSYFVKLDGEVDALVFAGGLGEKSADLRKAVTEKVRCLGFRLENRLNDRATEKEGTVVAVGGERVGDRGASGKVLIVRTDEQYEMARQAAADERFWK